MTRNGRVWEKSGMEVGEGVEDASCMSDLYCGFEKDVQGFCQHDEMSSVCKDQDRACRFWSNKSNESMVCCLPLSLRFHPLAVSGREEGVSM